MLKPLLRTARSHRIKPFRPALGRLNLNIQFTQPLQVRFYARQTARRTTVDTETKQQTNQENAVQGWQQQSQQSQAQRAYEPEPSQYEEGTQYETITPDTQVFLAKVYGTMMGGLGMAAVGAAVGVAAPVIVLPAAVGSFVGIIGLHFTARERMALRQNIFLGIGAMVGASIAPLVAISSAGVIFAAAVGTSAICAGFTLMALKAKRGAMLKLGGPLLGGLIFLVVSSLIGWLCPMMGIALSPAFYSALYNINLYGGLALFSLFVSYDTQAMIERYHAGDDDHVGPALQMFLNVINIFVRLLSIFGGRD